MSSGLAAAYKLKSHGLDVTVFEAEGRAGGRLRTVSQDGLVWDEGANTMVTLLIQVYLDSLNLQYMQIMLVKILVQSVDYREKSMEFR